MSPQFLHIAVTLAVLVLMCVLLVEFDAATPLATGRNVFASPRPGQAVQRLIFLVDRCGMIGSAYMRAVQMNNSRLLQTHYQTSVVSYDAINRHQYGLGDLVVFVKLHHRRSFARVVRHVQAAGAFAIADVVDDWHSPIPPLVRLDAIIFSNRLHADYELYRGSINLDRRWIVPHHHSNFEHLVRTPAPDNLIKTIGTSSGPAQRMPPHYRRVVRMWARLHNIRFKEHEFVEVGSVLTRLRCDIMGTLAPRLNESVYKDNAHIHRRINDIDVAIVVADGDEDALRFKPNTRMAMFHSHGIPVLSEPYQSYTEQYNASAAMYFTSPAELVQRLDWLRLHPAELGQLRRAALQNAHGYELEAIAQQYHTLFQKLN